MTESKKSVISPDDLDLSDRTPPKTEVYERYLHTK